MAAAAGTTAPAPAKEVVEKKVELMKEVCSTSPYFHTSVGVSCSFLPKLPALVLGNSAGESRNNLPLGFALVGLRRYARTRWRSRSYRTCIPPGSASSPARFLSVAVHLGWYKLPMATRVLASDRLMPQLHSPVSVS
jgi:hypothetical protein